MWEKKEKRETKGKRIEKREKWEEAIKKIAYEHWTMKKTGRTECNGEMVTISR